MSVKRYTPKINIIESSEDIKVQLWELHDADGRYVLHSDYAVLLARHNALREAVHKAMGRTADCDKKQTNEQLIADVAYLKRLLVDARGEVDRLLMEASNDGHS